MIVYNSQQTDPQYTSSYKEFIRIILVLLDEESQLLVAYIALVLWYGRFWRTPRLKTVSVALINCAMYNWG